MATVSELRAGLKQAGERFDAAFEGKEVEELEMVPVCGVWSSRDLVAHLVDWNSLLIAEAKHSLGGDTPHGMLVDIQEFNDFQSEARLNEPWQVSRAAFHASLDVADQMLATLSEDDLKRESDAVWGVPSSVERSFSGIVNHINEHLDELE